MRAVVFVGPPGAGKTTTLLSSRCGSVWAGGCRFESFRSKKTHQVAAQEKLRSLRLNHTGFGFTAANGVREFIEAMDEFDGLRSILLIDTPGFSFNDFEFAGDLIRFLRQMASKENAYHITPRVHESRRL